MKKLEEYKKDKLWIENPNSISIRSDILVSKRVIEILGNIENKKIVDLGCGNGKVARWLSQNRAIVSGVDLTNQQIEFARKIESEKNNGIEYLIKDISQKKFSLGTNYDAAIALMVHLYLDEKEFIQSIKNAYKVLKNGGTFIYANIHPCRILLHQEQKGAVLLKREKEINYFEIQQLSSSIISTTNTKSTTNYYNHPLEFVLNTLIETGFKIKMIHESQATKQEIKKYHQILSNENHLPSYLIVRCEK